MPTTAAAKPTAAPPTYTLALQALSGVGVGKTLAMCGHQHATIHEVKPCLANVRWVGITEAIVVLRSDGADLTDEEAHEVEGL